MVVEIKLMALLIEEIKTAPIPDEDSPTWMSDLHICLEKLELIGLLSMGVREWMGDPRDLLTKFDTQLGEIQEANPNWRVRVREVIQMI
jgi:hypothetical protein